MANKEAWFEIADRAHDWGAIWYWDGSHSWSSPRSTRQLSHSVFTLDGMRAHGSYREISDPWIPNELRLPEGL